MRVAPAWLSGYAGVILLMAALINLAVLLPRFSIGLILPFMEDGLHLSHFQAGSLFTAMSITGMAASVIFGILASRYGSRLIVGVAAITGGVATVFLGTSPNYTYALVLSAVIGFTTLGSITPTMGLLSVWFESRNRGTVAGLAAAGAGVGFVIVGALVPWLTGRDPVDGWRHTWYVLGAIVMVLGVLCLILLRDVGASRESRRGPGGRFGRPASPAGPRGSVPAGAQGVGSAWPIAAYRSPMVWLMTLLAFTSGWVEGLYVTFFGVYLEDQDVSVTLSGGLWMLLGVLGMAGGVLWGGVSDRLGRDRGFLLSFVILGLGCLLFWIAPVLAGFIGSVVLVGLTFRASYTICAAAAGDYVAPQFSAAAFGLMGTGAGLGAATGPLLGGYIADVTEKLGWVFVLGAGMSAIGAFSSVFLRRPAPNPEARI